MKTLAKLILFGLSAMAAVALFGCGVSKSTTENTRYERDDTTEVLTVDTATYSSVEQLSGVSYYTITAQPIPEDIAVIDIPLTVVAELPDGAGYIASEGRATAQVTHVGDNIKVEARCDSVARLCEIYRYIALDYMAANDSLRAEITKLDANRKELWENLDKQKEMSSNCVPGQLFIAFVALSACFLIIILGTLKFKKNG